MYFLSALAVLVLYSACVCSIPIDNGLILKAREIKNPEVETVCGVDLQADLMFVIDGSSSIQMENFELLRQFLVSFVMRLPESVQVGAVQFSGGVKTEFSFNTYGNEQDAVTEHFRKLQWLQGITNLGKALDYTIDKELIEKKGDRPDVNNIVMVITDGRSDDDPGPAADRMRANGFRVLAIGVTDFIDEEQLLAVGGKEEFVFTVASFAELDETLTDRILSNTRCVEVTKAPTLGEPSLDVECGPDFIRIASETQNPFEGQVYVKGHSNEPDCRVDGDGQNFAQITLPFHSCDTVRRRSLNPPGVFVENTVVFKFHPKFLTKIDRAFKIQCFYMEADKTVQNELEVSMLTTVEFTQQFPMPTCMYTIHKDSPDGDLIKFAVVGQPVYHRWECDNSVSEDLFKMKVKNCYVEDGEGERVELLDDDGCSIDKFLLRNLEYDDNGMLATVEAHVFKFADRPALYFQCQIELCVDYDGGCVATPPVCTSLARQKRRSFQPAYEPLTLDVITDRLAVVDRSDLDWDKTALNKTYEKDEISRNLNSVCLTDLEMYFFMVMTGGTFLLISAITFAQLVCQRSL